MQIGRFIHNGNPIICVNDGAGWTAYDCLLTAHGYNVPSAGISPDRRMTFLMCRGLLEDEVISEQLDWARRTGYPCPMDTTEGVPLLPLRPGKIVCVGRNYIEHAKEQGHGLPPHPIIFAKTDNCAIGPFQPIPYHQGFGRIDHEGELAVVIGKHTSNVLRDDANRHIFGYTIINDVTAREHQNYLGKNNWPWYIAKSMDGFAPIGPWVVTRNSFGDPSGKGVRVTVNGQLRQDGKFDDMAWKVPDLIEHISKVITLNPGDIIATGTPSGIGAIVPGDEVTVEIDGIGTLSNPVK